MKIIFREVKIGEEFRVNSDRFIKTDNTPYPRSLPLSRRIHNCINLNNRHRCVLGANVEVEVWEDDEDE